MSYSRFDPDGSSSGRRLYIQVRYRWTHGFDTFRRHHKIEILIQKSCILLVGDTQWRSWLRHCATSRKVAGSIPDGVIGIFHWHNPSDPTMALGLTQPLTEMSTRNTSWEVKAAGTYGWQPYHLHVPTVLKSGSLNLLEPSGPVQGCNGIAFCWFILSNYITVHGAKKHKIRQNTLVKSFVQEHKLYVVLSNGLPDLWQSLCNWLNVEVN